MADESPIPTFMTSIACDDILVVKCPRELSIFDYLFLLLEYLKCCLLIIKDRQLIYP